jgi:hypothetical protein
VTIGRRALEQFPVRSNHYRFYCGLMVRDDEAIQVENALMS